MYHCHYCKKKCSSHKSLLSYRSHWIIFKIQCILKNSNKNLFFLIKMKKWIGQGNFNQDLKSLPLNDSFFDWTLSSSKVSKGLHEQFQELSSTLMVDVSFGNNNEEGCASDLSQLLNILYIETTTYKLDSLNLPPLMKAQIHCQKIFQMYLCHMKLHHEVSNWLGYNCCNKIINWNRPIWHSKKVM